MNTIIQSRAPSTRRLYMSKWSVFNRWCTAKSVSIHRHVGSRKYCASFKSYWTRAGPPPRSKSMSRPFQRSLFQSRAAH